MLKNEGMIRRVPAWLRDGTSIKTRVVGAIVTFYNDTWIAAMNYAGSSVVNIFKVNTNDEIDVGGTLILGASIEAAEDSGAVTLVDMPVSATPIAGTEMSFTHKIDGNNILKIYAEADSSGGIQKPGIVAIYQINMKEMTTPTAVADYGALYTKADNKLYFQDGAGIEHEVAFV